MKPASIINMVKNFTDQYGVTITWKEHETGINSRGRSTDTETGMINSAKVLVLKEKFNPLTTISIAVGLSQDYTRYILALPEIELKKDMVITDNHNMKWKLGIIDWFDVGGVPVAKQTTLTEVL